MGTISCRNVSQRMKPCFIYHLPLILLTYNYIQRSMEVPRTADISPYPLWVWDYFISFQKLLKISLSSSKLKLFFLQLSWAMEWRGKAYFFQTPTICWLLKYDRPTKSTKVQDQIRNFSQALTANHRGWCFQPVRLLLFRRVSIRIFHIAIHIWWARHHGSERFFA